MTTNRVSPVDLLTRDLSPSSSPVDPYEVAPEDRPRIAVTCGVCGVVTCTVPAHLYNGGEDLCDDHARDYGSL